MSRFGIETSKALGISVTRLREIGRRTGPNHKLAQELWDSGIHEARILATIIDIPGEVTLDQMESWASDFDSWDIVDGCCGNLFDKTSFAVIKAVEWCKRPEEFVRRAGFVLMAELAVHDRNMPDETFISFFPLMIEGSIDDRNFVKKAVNWALRQIGKRNRRLNTAAIRTSKIIAESNSRAAKWIASDAIRELTGEPIRKKLALQ
jgi:3-methyladenine DNA glycosylase AlkD